MPDEKEIKIALDILKEMMPEDDFSISQWQIGLNFYKRKIKKFGNSEGKCLDFGCGTGNWSIASSEFFNEVIAIEKNVVRIKTAKRIAESLNVKNIIFVEYDDINQLKRIESNSISLILIYNVLSFVTNGRYKLLKELNRILSNDGKIYCSFNEFGVFPFFFFNGIKYFKFLRVIDVLKMIGFYFYKNISSFSKPLEKTYGWLNTKQFIIAAEKTGLVVEWKNWKNELNNEYLFPLTYLGLPFFREIILKKVK